MSGYLTDSTGKPSSSRLYTGIGVVTSSLCLVMVTAQHALTAGILGVYLGAVVLHGAVTKMTENRS